MKRVEFTLTNLENILVKLPKDLVSKIYSAMLIGYAREEYKSEKKIKNARLTESKKNSIRVYEKSFYIHKQKDLYCSVNFSRKTIQIYDSSGSLEGGFHFFFPDTDPRSSNFVFKPKVKLIKKS